MNKILIMLGMVFALSACSDADYSKQLLESQGYTNIRTTGHSFFACGKDDTLSTGFVATNPFGKEVKGTVCSGLFIKNASIKFSL